jgi:hypothetical protein
MHFGDGPRGKQWTQIFGRHQDILPGSESAVDMSPSTGVRCPSHPSPPAADLARAGRVERLITVRICRGAIATHSDGDRFCRRTLVLMTMRWILVSMGCPSVFAVARQPGWCSGDRSWYRTRIGGRWNGSERWAGVDDFASWERPAAGAAQLLSHWAPVRCELMPVETPPDSGTWIVLARPDHGERVSGDGTGLADRRVLKATLAGLIGAAVNEPDRRTEKLITFLAEELVGRFVSGEPVVRVAQGKGEVRVVVQGFRRTALLTVAAGGGEVDGHTGALMTVLESLLPLTNNESVMFDVGSGVHGLGPAADEDAVSAWWRAAEPWTDVGFAPEPDDEPRDERWDQPRRLDPAALAARMLHLEGLWGEVAACFGLDAGADEPGDPADHLAVWLWRDLVAGIDPGGSRAYEVAFPEAFEYGRDDATGCLLFIGAERYGLVAVDASL